MAIRIATRLAIAATLATCLTWTSPARAFSISTVSGGKEVKWNADTYSYYLDSNGWSGISNGKDKQQVTASFADWQNVSCSFLKFQKAGETSVSDVVPTGAQGNSKNEFIWKEGYWPYGSYVLGIAGPLISLTGGIVEADIALNGTIKWNTSGSTWSSMDVKSVAIHEIGHIFGLQHNLQYNESDPPTMAPVVDAYGKSATLHQDDKNGICFLYPKTPWTCSSDSQCPYVVKDNAQGNEYYDGKYKCQGGKCVPPGTGPVQPGAGELGAKCTGDAQCKNPNFCVETMEGSFCSQWCSVDAQDCATGFACFYVEEGNNEGLCFTTAGIATFGELCMTSEMCKSPYFCLEWWSGPFCTKECTDVDGGSGCPNGYTCYVAPTAPSGNGACYPGTPASKKDNGKLCTYSSECKSGLCFPTPGDTNKVCRQKCNPTNDTCPSDAKCIGLPGDASGTGGGCVPLTVLPEKKDGSSCEASWQCKDNYCYYDAELGQSSCRQLCALGSNTCPQGTKCLNIGGDQGACLPAMDPQPEGSFCQHHHECITGFCVMLPGTDKKVCRNACTLGSGCTEGFACVLLDDPEVGACMPEGKALGEICFSSVECTTQICWSQSGNQLCLKACIENQCPPGFTCTQPTPYGAVCTEKAGTSEVGVACNLDSECASGICMAGLCRAGCDVLAPACPVGQGCAPINAGAAGACVTPGAKPEGAGCSHDFECQSLLCIETGTGRECSLPCASPGATCQNGKVCAETAELAGLGICVAGTAKPDADVDDVTTQAPDDDVEIISRGGTGCSQSPTRDSGHLPLSLMLLLLLVPVWRFAKTFPETKIE